MIRTNLFYLYVTYPPIKNYLIFQMSNMKT